MLPLVCDSQKSATGPLTWATTSASVALSRTPPAGTTMTTVTELVKGGDAGDVGGGAAALGAGSTTSDVTTSRAGSIPWSVAGSGTSSPSWTSTVAPASRCSTSSVATRPASPSSVWTQLSGPSSPRATASARSSYSG